MKQGKTKPTSHCPWSPNLVAHYCINWENWRTYGQLTWVPAPKQPLVTRPKTKLSIFQLFSKQHSCWRGTCETFRVHVKTFASKIYSSTFNLPASIYTLIDAEQCPKINRDICPKFLSHELIMETYQLLFRKAFPPHLPPKFHHNAKPNSNTKNYYQI